MSHYSPTFDTLLAAYEAMRAGKSKFSEGLKEGALGLADESHDESAEYLIQLAIDLCVFFTDHGLTKPY